MRATEVLQDEHRVVERVLETLEKVTDRLQAGKTVSTEVMEDSVDFLNNFVDRHQHAKEESILFPAVKAAGGVEERLLVDEMMAEHEESRRYLGALSLSVKGYRQGDEAAEATLIESARSYIALLRRHIGKEEQILFPMVGSLLSDVHRNELTARFERLESERIGAGVHERYHQMVETLSRSVRSLKHPEA